MQQRLILTFDSEVALLPVGRDSPENLQQGISKQLTLRSAKWNQSIRLPGLRIR